MKLHQPMRKRVAALAAAFLAALLLGACSALPNENEDLPRELPPIPLRSRAITYPVEQIDLAVEVRGTAVVTPTREVELYFREPGRLTVLNVSVRDDVQVNQVLARLESADLEQELRLAEMGPGDRPAPPPGDGCRQPVARRAGHQRAGTGQAGDPYRILARPRRRLRDPLALRRRGEDGARQGGRVGPGVQDDDRGLRPHRAGTADAGQHR